MAGRKAREARAGDLARRDVPTCQLDDRLDEVRARVRASGWDVCVVVNQSHVVLGRLGTAAWAVKGQTPVEAVMKTPTTYRPDTPVDALREMMRAGGARDVLITDSDGRLVGLLAGQVADRSAGGRRRRGGRRSGRIRPRGTPAR
jgi:CBS domain-containing protein